MSAVSRRTVFQELPPARHCKFGSGNLPNLGAHVPKGGGDPKIQCSTSTPSFRRCRRLGDCRGPEEYPGSATDHFVDLQLAKSPWGRGRFCDGDMQARLRFDFAEAWSNAGE